MGEPNPTSTTSPGPDVSDLRTSEAIDRELCEHLRRFDDLQYLSDKTWSRLVELVAEAKRCSVHNDRGFRSWPDYVVDRVRKFMPMVWAGRINVEQRRRVVDLLAGEGMSQRAIADAIGVSQKTVDRDLDRVSHDDSAECESDYRQATSEGLAPENRQPDAFTVTGVDGKTYPAHPRRDISEPVDHDAWRERNKHNGLGVGDCPPMTSDMKGEEDADSAAANSDYDAAAFRRRRRAFRPQSSLIAFDILLDTAEKSIDQAIKYAEVRTSSEETFARLDRIDDMLGSKSDVITERKKHLTRQGGDGSRMRTQGTRATVIDDPPATNQGSDLQANAPGPARVSGDRP